MENYDYLVDSKVEVAFKQNLRADYIRNEFIINVVPEDPLQYSKMENTMNFVYNGFRANRVRLAEPGDPTPGKIVAALDKFKDHIGRFKRGRIIAPPREDADFTQESLTNRDFVFVRLIDVGKVETFPTSKLYRLLDKFAIIPPRAVKVQLSDLEEFQGSTKFGRLLESLLSRCSGQELMIKRVKENPRPGGPILVTLYSVEMKETLNQMLLHQLCSPSQDLYSETIATPGDASVFPGCLTHFNMEGEVFVKLWTPVSSVVHSCLMDIQANWEGESCAKLKCKKDAEVEADGSLFVGMHPQKGRVGRCRVVGATNKQSSVPGTQGLTDGVCNNSLGMGTGLPLKRSVQVQWVDCGDESEVNVEDLIPSRLCNSALEIAKPQAIKYRLANVQFLRSTSYLQHILSKGSKLTVKVHSPSGEAPSDPASTGNLLEVELLYNHWPRDSLHFVVKNINNKLLKLGEAQGPEGDSLTLVSNPAYVQSAGNCQFPQGIQALDWLYKRPDSSPSAASDLTTVLKPKDKIAFYIGEVPSSGDSYTIHPWATKEQFDLIKSSLRLYFEECKWSRPAWGRLHRLQSVRPSPTGAFCAYEKSGEWYRGKIIRELRPEEGPNSNQPKSRENQPVEILLIDEGKYVRDELASVTKMFPSAVFGTLGHQGAQVQLKSSKKMSNSPSGAKDLKNKEKDDAPQTHLRTLAKEQKKSSKKMSNSQKMSGAKDLKNEEKTDAPQTHLRTLAKEQKRVVAVIEDIQTDSHGRVHLTLLDDEDSGDEDHP